MRNLLTKGLLCICLLLSQTYIFSQNHSTCETVDLLLLDTNCNGIATGPGANSGDPTGYDGVDGNPCDPQFSKGDDYIYIYTATNTQALKLELWASDYVSLLITTGCPTTGTCFAVSTSYVNDYQSLITPGMTVGEDYYIQVSALDEEDSAGQFCMDAELVAPPQPPANDECIDATPITITSELNWANSIPGTIRLATASPENSASCANSNPNDDVWYSFVATANSLVIRFLNLGNLNGGEYLKHSLWEGNCGSLTLKNDCPFARLSVQNDLIIGNTYFIRVYSQFAGPTTLKYDICVSTLPSPPANDECSSAYPVTPGLTHKACNSALKVYGSLGGATASPEDTGSCEGDEDDDVWFSFVAGDTKHTIRFIENFTIFSSYFTNSIWTGDCGALTLVKCDESSPQQLTDLTIGDTYYIRVYTEESTPSVTEFNVCISTPSTTVNNDVCTNSITLDIPDAETCQGSTSITNIDITENTGEEATCDGFQNYGIWYDFVAPTNGAFIFESINDLPGIEIYEGSNCSNLTPVAGTCIDNHEGGGTVSGLTAGNNYYALIWTDKSYAANLEFCVYSSVCIAPKYTAVVDESACPKISITVDITDIGSATSVDIIPDIGTDSFIGVGPGVYTLYGYTVDVEDMINVTVSDNADPSCNKIINLENADVCVPNCEEAPQIGCGQNVNTGDLTGIGEWSVLGCNSPGGAPTREKVYRFIPTEDGDHTLHVENIVGSGLITYYYRTDAICETTDWTCLGTVYSTTTDFVIPNLVAGSKVYILIDGRFFYESRIHNFRIECDIASCALTASRVYVNSVAAGDNTGCSWEHAFPTLQMAFEAMELNPSLTEIWVQKGTYYPAYGNDRFSSFSIDQSINIYGAFAGDETDINQRDIPNTITTISGNIAVQGATYDNSYHIFTIESGANQVVIDGFNIISGNADGIAMDNQTGAGVLCYGNAELINCTISQCESVNEGSAIRLDGINNTLTCENVTATGNTTGGNGSAVSLKQTTQLNIQGLTRFE